MNPSDMFEHFYIREQQEEMMEAFAHRGMAGIKDHIEQKLQEWQNTPVSIGVTGRSGVGKSSFINTMRNLDVDDEGAAEVGVTETTTTATAYKHPKNQNLILWDLPGVGTPALPKKEYLTNSAVGFDNYDIFVIITACRFTEDDMWLAQAIENCGKLLLFVRSKLDQELANDRKARKKFYAENKDADGQDVVDKVREICQSSLEPLGKRKIYLIDSYKPKHPLLEFDKLFESMINGLSELKKEALILSMTKLTPHIIDAKKDMMRSRMYKIGLMSGLIGAVPIPGMSLKFDIDIVLHEAKFYRNQFGLDEDALEEIARYTGVDMDSLSKSAELKSLAVGYTRAGMVSFCSVLGASEIAEKYVEYFLPIIGRVIGGATSASSTIYALKRLLDMMVSDAMKVNEFVKKHILAPTGDMGSVDQ